MTIVLNIFKAIIRWTWKFWAGAWGIFAALVTVGTMAKWLRIDPPETKLVWSGPLKVLEKFKQ